jgi:hypothetical protein
VLPDDVAPVEDPAVDEIPDHVLPHDDEEFASPPPPLTEKAEEPS